MTCWPRAARTEHDWLRKLTCGLGLSGLSLGHAMGLPDLTIPGPAKSMGTTLKCTQIVTFSDNAAGLKVTVSPSCAVR